MAKTELTTKLERNIYRTTNKQGVFGCFEVTIGWYGRERVDYMTYDTKGIWRCYEVKVSLADFKSTAYNTFVGHYNYYVLTAELYEKVKHLIPAHVGVYVNGLTCKKRPKKLKELPVEESILTNSMIRSLAREAEKFYRGQDENIVHNQKRRINQLIREVNQWKKYYYDIRDKEWKREREERRAELGSGDSGGNKGEID